MIDIQGREIEPPKWPTAKSRERQRAAFGSPLPLVLYERPVDDTQLLGYCRALTLGGGYVAAGGDNGIVVDLDLRECFCRRFQGIPFSLHSAMLGRKVWRHH
ncbi:hypothetical protein [Microvirga splendida]|uniref:Uncharacterized protein n=1 Tax=Microvirga splendida TaxID=2795727 RepID=A0ABS0XZC7_9HYPH|nr:hypothetical protein [Microvirga splendida]MBJ6125411.1 hypothetical protein [Microvirga splendida]